MNNIKILSFSEASEAIVNLYSSDYYTQLSRLRQVVPYMETIRKSRDETAHSAFLCWMFNNPELQNSLMPPLLSLLRLLALRADVTTIYSQMDQSLQHEILTNNINIHKLEANIERTTKSKSGNGRVDIEINISYAIGGGSLKKMRIILENKIDSNEHDQQCKKYYADYSQKNDVDTSLYVYVSPDNGEQLSDPHFIQISYQDILDKIISPLMVVSDSLSARVNNYLCTFIESITSIRHKKGQLAMDEKTRKLLTDFYNNNEELILAAINAAAPDEVKKQVNIGKNYDSYELTYTVNGRQKTEIVSAKSRLAKKFVEIYLEIHPNTTFNQIKDLLKSVKSNLVYLTDKPRTYKIEGKDWYIESGIWGDGHPYFTKLKELMSKNGIDISEI